MILDDKIIYDNDVSIVIAKSYYNCIMNDEILNKIYDNKKIFTTMKFSHNVRRFSKL